MNNSLTSICEPCVFSLQEQRLELLAEKAIFWKEESLLLIADLHLGKVNHFRKSGIPIPTHIIQNDLNRLSGLMEKYAPKKILFLGDLFHSNRNKEWEIFVAWREKYQSVTFELVRGNHDIIASIFYKRTGIKVYLSCHVLGPFLFSHEPTTKCPPGKYPISGHIHPCIILNGKAKQSIRVPCFYFGRHQALLPAFGAFTGLSTIVPGKRDAVFAIADNNVLRV